MLVESLFISNNLSPDLKQELKLIVNPEEDEANFNLEKDVVEIASLLSMNEIAASKNTFIGKNDNSNIIKSHKKDRKIKEDKPKFKSKKKCCGFV